MKLFSDKAIQKIYPIVIIIGCVAFAMPLIAHAYNGTFMRINGDEYCYLAVQSQHGFWGTQWYSYQSVSGMYNGNRYSLNFALALLGQFGPRLPSITPALALSLWFTAWFFALWQAAKFWGWKFRWFEVSLITEVIIFFTLYIVSDVTQILYWYGGMAQYMSPLILNGFILGIIFLAARKSSKILSICLMILGFLSGGFSETPGVVQVAYLALFCAAVIYLLRRTHEQHASRLLLPSSLALAGSILALLALAFAPSTAPRLAHSSHPTPLGTVANSLIYGGKFIAGTIQSTPLPILLLLLLAFSFGFMMRDKLSRLTRISIKTMAISMAILIAVWYLLCVVSMSPSVYAQDAYPGERALLPARFISILVIFSLGWLAGYSMPLIKNMDSHRVIISLSVLVMVGVLYAYPLRSVPKITANIAFYAKWSEKWDARNEEIRQAQRNGQRDIEVMTIDHPIKDVGELSPDPSYWYNVCASQYYGLNSIKADLPGWDN